MYLQRYHTIPTIGARSVCAFEIEDVAYLAVSRKTQNISNTVSNTIGDNSDACCVIYRYKDDWFHKHQELEITGSESANFFTINGRNFLAVANKWAGDKGHSYNQHSIIFEWVNGRFARFQSFPTFAARKWYYFEVEGRSFLALAQGIRPHKDFKPCHPSRSMIFEWKDGNFVEFQELLLSEEGYDWSSFDMNGKHFLAYADGFANSLVLL